MIYFNIFLKIVDLFSDQLKIFSRLFSPPLNLRNGISEYFENLFQLISIKRGGSLPSVFIEKILAS